MGVITEHCNLWVCEDCIMYIANGNAPVDGPDRTPIFGEMWEGWQTTTGWYKADGETPDKGSDTDEFSWSPCDGCDSRLGGARHKACAFKVETA